MIKKAASYFVTAYLCLMFCLFPLYVREGYTDMGEAKFHFFKIITLSAAWILGGLSLLLFFNAVRAYVCRKRVYLLDVNRISGMDLLVLLYGTELFLSFGLSEWKKEALWGTEGWYMGTLTLLLLCALYFFISRFWEGGAGVIYGLLLSSSAVFLLGICNRFSCYPFAFQGADPGFISTLGNINWYCGFLSVAGTLGILFLMQKKGNKILLSLYTLLTFTTAFSQGSTSVFLWFGALFFFWIYLVKEEKGHGQAFLWLLFLWGTAAQLVRLMRYFWPGSYSYDTDNLCGYVTDSSLTLWIAIFALAAFLFSSVEKGKERELLSRLKKPLLFLMGAVFLLWLTLGLWHTLKGDSLLGLPFFENHSFFTFDSHWGNGRGAAFYAAIQAYLEMPLFQKLIGVGADCFSAYVYSLPELSLYLREMFGGARLTNAHNEILTNLVNTGLVGTLLYAGIFVRLFVNYRKDQRKFASDLPGRQMLTALAGAIFCCLVHNLVSFSQILNLPFVFLFLGMYEGKRRRMSEK